MTTKISAPNLSAQTADQNWKDGTTYNFSIANTFTDPQNQKMTYVAYQENGIYLNSIPSWLKFDTTTGTFTGTVPTNLTSDITIEVLAKNSSGLVSAPELFVIHTTPPVVAPTLTTQTADQNWKDGSAYTFTPTNAFTDPQHQSITYTAYTLNGSSLAALPSWLKFNTTTDTFTGTVPNNLTSDITIELFAKNSSGLTSVADKFVIHTTPPVVAPTLTTQTADQSWTDGKAYTFTPTNAFTDPQHQTLTYSAYTLTNGAQSALPSWLKFDTNTDTFTGTVPNNLTSDITVEVFAKNTSGLVSAPDKFVIHATQPISPPNINNLTQNQTWNDGSSHTFNVGNNIFSDPQGQTLTYSAYALVNGQQTALPSWLTFNSVTDTFTGTVPTNQTGSLAIEVFAKNASGLLSGADTFTITFNNPNPTPAPTPPTPAPTPTNVTPIANPLNAPGGYSAINTTADNTWLYGSTGVSYKAVNQGGMGDCFVLSSIQDIAAQNPSFITNMITNNGNGIFTVNLYDTYGTKHAITINDQLPNSGCTDNGYGHYAGLIEKAYAGLQGDNYNSIANGGQMYTALSILTGQPAAPLSSSQFNMSNIISILNSGGEVSLGSANLFVPTYQPDARVTGTLPQFGNGEGYAVGLGSLHAYSILGVDTASNMLIVGNPWDRSTVNTVNIPGTTTKAVIGSTEDWGTFNSLTNNSGSLAGNAKFYSTFEISANDLHYFFEADAITTKLSGAISSTPTHSDYIFT